MVISAVGALLYSYNIPHSCVFSKILRFNRSKRLKIALTQPLTGKGS